MVLGPRLKNKRSLLVKLKYLINVHEIKPWPPSQSMRSLRSVVLQWENGERSSGSTSPVTPSLGLGADGRIEFNESFKINVTLSRDSSVKSSNTGGFQKNLLEFNLYEQRRDKTVKGKLLGTGTIDFAEYGVLKEGLSISVPINSKRSFSNTEQSVMFINIQPLDKGRLSRDMLQKETSLDNNNGDFISTLLSEKYYEEIDDASSQSSLTVASSNVASTFKDKENGSGIVKPINEGVNEAHDLALETEISKLDTMSVSSNQHEKSNMFLPDQGVPIIDCTFLSRCGDSNLELFPQENDVEVLRFYSSPNGKSEIGNNVQSNEKCITNGHQIRNTHSSTLRDVELRNNIINADRLKHVKSVRSPYDSARSNGAQLHAQIRDQMTESGFLITKQISDVEINSHETNDTLDNGKLQQLEVRINTLERELREFAAIEVALYSVVADHGSSISKVHAPARRLSRLYLHACKESPTVRKASAARTSVSGLVLVAKACGNDVSRLTFWLSNSVMLRVMINQAIGKQQKSFSNGPHTEIKDDENGNNKNLATLKWKERKRNMYGSLSDWEDPHTFTSALEKIEAWIFSRVIESIWWQTLTPYMQSVATKAINRDIDHCSSKTYQTMLSLSDEEQTKFSMDLWKKAFKDACERLCPVRAGGHECGCLSILSRLIMEQCVSRLDVAMFNGILREHSDDIPTDPVSDPISDPTVLPFPSGRFSFGAGAQLKNVVGNWSRWLTDHFGIDDDVFEDENEHYSDYRIDSKLKSFHLLNALSDLMMLPKDMLLSRSIRREVCSTFGVPLIKRVLMNFVPDEFCPDPIPDVVLEVLDSEDHIQMDKCMVMNFPCAAAPVLYVPPPISSLVSILEEFRSQSYSSDNELDEFDSPLTSIIDGSPTSKESRNSVRYQLLREMWLSSE